MPAALRPAPGDAARTASRRLRGALLFLLVACQASLAESRFPAQHFDDRSQAATALRWMAINPLLSRNQDASTLSLEGGSGVQIPPEYDWTPNISAASQSQLAELPYAAMGKLFFKRPDGSPATCSAGFAGADDVIITAAHCLMQRDGSWNSDVMFYRLYGAGPPEVFAISCMATTRGWEQLDGAKQLYHDVAFLKTARPNEAGSLGVSKGLPAEYLLVSGYANKYFNGQRMITLTAPSFYSRSGFLGTKGNPLGSGSSGTPWTAMETVYSVSSFFAESHPNVMWGPRITTETLELMDFVRSGCE